MQKRWFTARGADRRSETILKNDRCKLVIIGFLFDRHSSFLEGAAPVPPVIQYFWFGFSTPSESQIRPYRLNLIGRTRKACLERLLSV
jgi:hypothetical protein